MSPETADAIRQAADVVQWVNLATALGILTLVLAAGWRWPAWRRVLALPLVYGLLAVGFYAATLANLVPAPWTSLLSAGLRLYAHMLMLSVLGVAVYVALTENDEAEGDDGD